MAHQLNSHISMTLSGLEAPGFYPYNHWQDAFVERWDMIPDLRVPDLSRKYREMHHPGQLAFSCLEALRIFYVNQFEPRPEKVVAQFIADFQKVPKQIVEPTWENDPHTGERLAQYNDQLNHNSDRAKGREIFDMNRGAQPR